MTRNSFGVFIGVIIAAVLIIIILATGLWKYIFYPKTDYIAGPVIITPGEPGVIAESGRTGGVQRNENLNTIIPLQPEETAVTVFNRESEDGITEEQFVAFLPDPSSEQRINLTYIHYDPAERQHKRLWNLPTAAARADTITIFSNDLIGDRNNCIIVTGMNARNEHTMTIFRRNMSKPIDQPFDTIAEIQIDGSIIIQETVRTTAYGQGITTGTSYNIAAYGHDTLSANLLDQIETTYSFNPSSGIYEQTRVTRIPGSQIEQRRLRELLSGQSGVFEEFINDLWYYISPAGTVDSKQYIYFDPQGREIIFYSDDAQQVFRWQTSNYTRYGMHIRSQNISITTLLRSIDIELESLDSIKLRVVEDVRLRIAAHTSWDGSYRRARVAIQQDKVSSVRPGINAQYDSTWGRIQFLATGEYTITSGNLAANASARKGNYVFFTVADHELLEMRPLEYTRDNRMVFKVEKTQTGLSLSHVRLGTSGVQDLYETPVILTLVE